MLVVGNEDDNVGLKYLYDRGTVAELSAKIVYFFSTLLLLEGKELLNGVFKETLDIGSPKKC